MAVVPSRDSKRRCLDRGEVRTGDVATSLGAIKTAIGSVNEFITSTAAAVEEQSIVTSDMSTNMQRASAELA